LATVQSRSFDPRRAAVLDRAVEPTPAGTEGRGMDTVRFDHLGNDAVELEIEATRPGLLVLSDLYLPRWRAAVGGEERPIYRANAVFRGVAVDAGGHTVRFWYHPRAFRLGAAISGITALVLLMSALGAVWHARRRLTSPMARAKNAA